MIVIHDDRFFGAYATDNAACPGRMEAALSGLRPGPWALVAPPPASDEQLLLAHDPAYLAASKQEGLAGEEMCGGNIFQQRHDVVQVDFGIHRFIL